MNDEEVVDDDDCSIMRSLLGSKFGRTSKPSGSTHQRISAAGFSKRFQKKSIRSKSKRSFDKGALNDATIQDVSEDSDEYFDPIDPQMNLIDTEYLLYEVEHVQHHIRTFHDRNCTSHEDILENMDQKIDSKLDFKSQLYVKAHFQRIISTIKLPGSIL